MDEFSIRAGVNGVIQAMRLVGMLPPSRRKRTLAEPFVARSSVWMRAHDSGICLTRATLGDRVKKGQVLADNNYTKDGTLALGTNLKAA